MLDVNINSSKPCTILECCFFLLQVGFSNFCAESTRCCESAVYSHCQCDCTISDVALGSKSVGQCWLLYLSMALLPNALKNIFSNKTSLKIMKLNMQTSISNTDFASLQAHAAYIGKVRNRPIILQFH